MDTIREVIGRKLAEWRGSRSADAVAALLNEAVGVEHPAPKGTGWSRQTVIQAEQGRRAWAVDDLMGLARAMNVSVAELVASAAPVKVGEWTATPSDLHRLTAGASAHIEAGKAHFRDLVTLAQLVDNAETAYTELLSEIRYQYSVHPELLAYVADYRADLLRDKVEGFKAVARRDVTRKFESQGMAPKGKAFNDAVTAATSDYLRSVPALRAANDAKKAMDQGTFPSVSEEWSS